MTETVRLARLAIRDFRNIAAADLAWPAGGAVVIGANGMGKTNLLEAIHYGHALRGFRGTPDREAVRFEQGAFHLSFVATGARCNSLGIGAPRSGVRKKVVVDGVPVTRLADAFAAIPSVVMSPRDAEAIHGPPAARRQFLDVLLAATSPRYLVALQRYRAALAQRSAVLRGAPAREQLAMAAAWEGTLAESGAVLWASRREWVSRWGAVFTAHCHAIGESGAAAMRHHTGQGVGDALDEPALRDALAERLATGRDEDLRRGATMAGPHRDDLRLTLGGRSVRSFASAGQQRTMALALRLVEWASLCDALRRRPILLLDDPFAELDRGRVDRILDLLRDLDDVQRVLVVPRADEVPAAFTALDRWRIDQGVVHVG